MIPPEELLTIEAIDFAVTWVSPRFRIFF